MIKKVPKAILFDWDNTLIDSQQSVDAALNHTLKKIGNNGPLTSRYSHISRKEYLIGLFGDKWKEANTIYQQHLDQQALTEDLKLNQGVVEMLEELKQYNIYLAIVSNKEGNYLRQEVNHLGLNDYFKKIVGSRDTPEDKPSPRPILFALEGSRIEPSDEVLFVGDSITDVHCARNADCLPIIYGQPIVGCEDLLSFKSFDKLTKFIQSILEVHNE